MAASSPSTRRSPRPTSPRRLRGPRLPRGGRRPARGDLLRRDLRLRAPGRGRQAGAEPAGQGGAGRDGQRRVRQGRAAARADPSSGADPFAAMAPFRAAVDQFHQHTAPSDWIEGLVKAFVGDGLADDFYREIAAYLDPHPRPGRVLARRRRARGVRRRAGARAPSRRTTRLGGRLALWGRRLMGEALIQAQRVAAERDALSALLAGGVDRPGWTSRRSGGCSPGSPSVTPSGWPSSDSRRRSLLLG